MAKVQQLSNVPVCEDEFEIDEGVQTLSYTMIGMKMNAHKPKNPCQPVSWQYSMNFDSMIKPNPMRSDVKYSIRDTSSIPEYPFDGHCGHGKDGLGSLMKNLESDSSVSEMNTSCGEMPSIITRNIDHAHTLGSLENVGNLLEVPRAGGSEDITMTTKSLEIKSRNFPTGILKVGDKSKFSRVLDDCPKAKGFKQEAPSTFSRLRIGF